MNIEETKRAIEVMQAFVDGKRVEVKCNGEWKYVTNPDWDWWESDYRIATEPEHIQIIKELTEGWCSGSDPWCKAMGYLKREGY